MKNIRKSFKLLFLYSFLLVFLLKYSKETNAQAILPLIVSPARQQIEVNPGEKTAIDIKFFNSGDQPVSGILKVADFIVEDKFGNPVIIDNPLSSSLKYSAAQWFSLPYNQMSIPIKDKLVVQANINIPKDAYAGGHYVAIYFEPVINLTRISTTNKNMGTEIATRLAGLIYLKVRGDILEKALVSRFFTPSFLEYGPIKIDTEILNRGNYHIRPHGTISLTNMFGKLIEQQKLKEANIFPDASFLFNNELGSRWMIGKYRVNLAVAYGEKGQILTSSRNIFIFPWRIAIAIIFIIFIIFFLISKFYKKMYT